MNRPQVQIESENKISTLRRHLEKMLPEFEALPGVIGLILNGGLLRGYADHLSEIDVTIYLTSGGIVRGRREFVSPSLYGERPGEG